MAANFSILVLLLISLCTISFISSVHGGNGFSVDLIHRDSPLSPFYNPSEKPFERVQNAIHRSINRVNHFKKSSSSVSVSTDTITSTVTANNGEYLMKFALGTPPHEILAIADTGSDLTWIQCKPCTECYKQIAPLFNPHNSSTYRLVSCSSRTCEAFGSVSCDAHDDCSYSISYGDQSYTFGNMAVETFTFDSTTGRSVALPKIAFGCGHNNAGTFDKRAAGLVGLGGGPLSLISQLGSTIESKFSYCLIPLGSKSKTNSSKLNFGSHAEISGEGVVSTPIVPKPDITFYYLTLEGLSVGDNRIDLIKTSSKSSVNDITSSNVKEGNIIIDSGTTLTLLPPAFYEELESEVKNAVDLEPTTPPQGLSLCYNYSGDGQDIKLPTITAHFTDADVVLQPLNNFIEADEGVICLTFIPSEELTIFGNLAQMNFLVEYDLENMKVSFKPTDCSKEEEE